MRRLLALAAALQLVPARILHSLPEDTYAFPKYQVSFLNGLTLSNETAQRWLKEGLQGGELEFLDQPWKDGHWEASSHLKEIASGDTQEPFTVPGNKDGHPSSHSLEHMKFGPRESYLCLIPNPTDIPSQAAEEEDDSGVTTVRSWSLLQPLVGTCLYHRQGWFTYSYCHNEEIRQFKELVQANPHAPGGYKPEEDPDWESYTLGRAPVTPEPGADLTVAEQNAIAANLELARGAGSRYLVQKWGDGTICDKTGKKREVEVQFHCSMTMTDTILFVKETKTCSYVLVINTPRLCGEPGFRSRRDTVEEAHIRCRRIVDAVESASEEQASLPKSDHPVKPPQHKTVLGTQQEAQPAEASVTDAPTAGSGDKPSISKEQAHELVRKALEALVGGKAAKNLEDAQVYVERIGDEDAVFVELDNIHFDNAEELGGYAGRIAEALRAAGIDVKGTKVDLKNSDKADKGKGKKKTADTTDDNPYRDEH